MLRGTSATLRILAHSTRHVSPPFSTSAVAASTQPNAALDIDPSLKVLLQDIDISLTSHKHIMTKRPPRELETVAIEDLEEAEDAEDFVEDHSERSEHRKSPAARFGSKKIGAVVMPTELQKSITALIDASDKIQLHSDATRLFFDESEGWDHSYDVKYRSYKQGARHSDRDGTAFASVVLPAHYSAICAVLHQVKHRLGPEWNVQRVIDWGAGTGSGLWASMNTFQKPNITSEEPRLSTSNIFIYLGIDKREGLVAIGKRLLRDTDLGALSATWQKSFREDDIIKRTEGRDTLALSAFMLSTLQTPLARKKFVKELWESGAHTIVLIDHKTKAGFQNIAEAREYLLEMGRKELNDPETADWPVRGAHVVAPCPHDGSCPLYSGTSVSLVCGFSQRLQRPPFVRLTKHAREGHEDIEYSYVAIQRGPRPSTVGEGLATQMGSIGRVGAVGREEAEQIRLKEERVTKELVLDTNHIETRHEVETTDRTTADIIPAENSEEVEAALRHEAFHWPRLVFPPLKKSGHIIIDACTSEGKIMRLTIPKSQGKQPFYDARKSSWGDIFPHPPKNRPQERIQSTRAKGEGGSRGDDIGKRSKGRDRPKGEKSYSNVGEALKERKKASRRDRAVQKEDFALLTER
ncbi:mitochondrial small ribosomal subunit Rsm22-domain-containing protein [Suillus paluster]|uniref:mitochondrial small ribosomal subunit Rsm22-domain-containing protein n=1 Tax=Suillus paluster TaxID=48578 RepID=UPI001B86EB60|nr:mitochondrial small ribosomal subunit Rsm22-domain-containing protein [Suillus paluster]KAG1754790.1 mitochondrial small ribosomal subunit Rsm22-domain-containing protein [Suillus paluster]